MSFYVYTCTVIQELLPSLWIYSQYRLYMNTMHTYVWTLAPSSASVSAGHLALAKFHDEVHEAPLLIDLQPQRFLIGDNSENEGYMGIVRTHVYTYTYTYYIYNYIYYIYNMYAYMYVY